MASFAYKKALKEREKKSPLKISHLRGIMRFMKRYFLTGLIILLPVTLTIMILAFIVNFLTKPFRGMVAHFLAQTNLLNKKFLFLTPEQVLRYGSQLIVLVCLFLVILFVGMFARWFFLKWIMDLTERIMHRVPLVNKIYKGVKDIVTHFFGEAKTTFRQVVMVPFAKEGIFVLGLLSREAPKTCSEKANIKLHTVFIPTTPNPTTGFLFMYPEHEIIYIDMKPEDAIKYIVSCGVVVPPESPQEEPVHSEDAP